MSSNKQTTIKVGGLGWKVSHLIVIWQCTLRRPANFHVTTSRIIIFCTDYRYPMKPFFNDNPKLRANWADRPNKFLGICGILGRTISGPNLALSMISIILLFFLQKTLLFRTNPKYIPNMILAQKNHASIICELLHMYYFLLLSLACHLRLLIILGWPKIMKYMKSKKSEQTD